MNPPIDFYQDPHHWRGGSTLELSLVFQNPVAPHALRDHLTASGFLTPWVLPGGSRSLMLLHHPDIPLLPVGVFHLSNGPMDFPLPGDPTPNTG